MDDNAPRSLLVSRQDAAAEIGTTTYWVDRLIQAGHLEEMRLGHAIRIHRNSLEAFKARHTETAESA